MGTVTGSSDLSQRELSHFPDRQIMGQSPSTQSFVSGDSPGWHIVTTSDLFRSNIENNLKKIK